LIAARERAGDLLLRSDRRLATELADDRLAPLSGLSAGARERLTDTLEAWLAEQGRLGQVAARLGIHPQTVRYRVARLRELFGDALDDPDERFWLAVALRARDGARSTSEEGGGA
jgi:DNA-binding PucR family transcriptional regulator